MTSCLRPCLLAPLLAACLGGLAACSSDAALAHQPADSDARTVWGSKTPAGSQPIDGPTQNDADAGPKR